MDFKIEACCSGTEARVGVLRTPHGEVKTSAFVAVATRGTVKALSADDGRALGIQILIGNTYHLTLRPGAEVVGALGGLHGFSALDSPWMRALRRSVLGSRPGLTLGVARQRRLISPKYILHERMTRLSSNRRETRETFSAW